MEKHCRTREQLERLIKFEFDNIFGHQNLKDHVKSRENLISYCREYKLVTGYDWQIRK